MLATTGRLHKICKAASLTHQMYVLMLHNDVCANAAQRLDHLYPAWEQAVCVYAAQRFPHLYPAWEQAVCASVAQRIPHLYPAWEQAAIN